MQHLSFPNASRAWRAGLPDMTPEGRGDGRPS